MAIEKQMEMEPDATAAEEPAEEQAESSSETVSLPMSILGGQEVKPGDVVRLEVVSADGDNVTVKYASEAPAPVAEEKKGMEGMAAAFD